MFLLSLAVPILARMLTGRVKRVVPSGDIKEEFAMNIYPQPTR